MAAVAMSPQPVNVVRDEHVMDTRTPSPIQRTDSEDSTVVVQTPATDTYKPDLGAEVAMLSTKLVNAINYQTNLDDSLQQTRHELEQARKETDLLRAQKREYDEAITGGALLRKAQVDRTMAQLREELANERAARESAEKAKKQTEGELENLTTALFEEANTMVAAARKDTEALERRNSQLRGQLNDTELLLASQQEQLQDLKTVMERMEEASERDGAGSVPSTPIHSTTAAFDHALQLSPHRNGHVEVQPDNPLHFSHLLAPILRNDITAYTDFQELLLQARRGAPHSRNSSQTNGNTLTSSSQTNLTSAAASSSSPNLPGAFSFSASNSPQSSTFQQTPTPPLKESKFYKRTLTEDIEPTLRLDLAPGLSFLSRRTVLSTLLNGSLVVEPFSPTTKFYGPVFSCALCGEHRKNEPYVRKHRFRTSEEDSAQRYPLCDYCLSRIRTTGDFVGFLRMVRDGHWRAENEDEQRSAWEESVRLREKMFWARLGGGVVPAGQLMSRKDGGPEDINVTSPESARAVKSARTSLESIPERGAKANSVVAASQSTGESDIPLQLSTSNGQDMSNMRPETPPSRQRQSQDEAVTVPTLHEPSPPRLDSEPETLQPSASTTDDDPPTPFFEDAQTESQSSQDQQLHASEQLQREAEAGVKVPTATETSITASSNTATEMPSADAEAMPPPPNPSQAKEEPPVVNLSTPTPPPTERRPSGVLARVRAMEAKAQAGRSASPEKKFPGAFD